MPVFFHSEETNYRLKERKILKVWIAGIVSKYGYDTGNLNVILTSNDYLLKINKEYLDHHYFTDVITFNYNTNRIISGDIFLSVDQIKLNSIEHSVTFVNELNRVIIHGVLHLLGFDDKTKTEKEIMRTREDEALSILQLIRDGKTI